MADLHLTIDRAKGDIAGQIARELRDAIRTGRLAPGTRLPASRDLAKDLGFSRGVVVEAYERLVAEGFLEARVGVGTRVADVGPGDPPPSAVPWTGPPPAGPLRPLRPTSPDLGAFPRQAWLAAIRHVLTTLPHDAFGYGEPGGVPALREEVAAHLRRVRAADATPENTVVVTGVAQGLSLLLHVLSARKGGEVVLAVEDPTSPRQLPLLRRAGAAAVPVPVDEEGIVVEALAETGAEAVLVTPAHQYPTGVVLSPRRRAELIAWAARTGALVIEDDYDAEFRFDRDPVGCLQGLAPDRVVLLGSVSKGLAPGLRLGWAVAPSWVAGSVRLARGELDLGSPVLEQYALAHLIATGRYARHLRRMRREYRARRDALVAALNEHLPWIEVRGISAGLHLCARYPAPEDGGPPAAWDPPALAAAARSAGLPAEPVRPVTHRSRELVIGFAPVPAHRMSGAVRDLAALIRRGPAPRTGGAPGPDGIPSMM